MNDCSATVQVNTVMETTNTLENGRMTECMEQASLCMLVEMCMMGPGTAVSTKEMALMYGLMDGAMR